MMEGEGERRTANRYGAPCRTCSQYVAAETGVRVRVEREDGSHGWLVEHRGECPAPPARKTEKPELPRWGVYCRGRTPLGLETDGVALVDGEAPDRDAVPVNDAAKAIAERWREAGE